MNIQDYSSNCMCVEAESLERNAKACVEAAKVPVIAVVKLDGYGVGIQVAARAWQKAGAAMFAVSESWEAVALRQAGFTEDILLMAPVADPDTLRTMLENKVILTVGDRACGEFYQRFRGDATVRVHVKVDTGMGRFGFRWDDGDIAGVYRMEGLQVEGIYSHFAKSFEKKYDLTGRQLARFLLAVKSVEDAGIAPGMRHIANSCAALRFPQTRLDAVRIGSGLVGALLAPVPLKLESAHRFRARVVAVKQLKKGDTTGYASVCRVKRNTRAVVVAVGFSHGYGMTGAPDPYPVRDFLSYIYHLWQRWRNPPRADWNGRQLKLLGRVGSQYTLFDAGELDIGPGEFVSVRMNLLQCPCRRVYQ